MHISLTISIKNHAITSYWRSMGDHNYSIRCRLTNDVTEEHPPWDTVAREAARHLLGCIQSCHPNSCVCRGVGRISKRGFLNSSALSVRENFARPRPLF